MPVVLVTRGTWKVAEDTADREGVKNALRAIAHLHPSLFRDRNVSAAYLADGAHPDKAEPLDLASLGFVPDAQPVPTS